MEKNTGRIVIATFASNAGRVIQLIESAIRHDRVVFLSIRSMINNVAICQELGYIKEPKNYIRNLRDLKNMPDERIMILCTGAQGEEFSALARMHRGEHAQVKSPSFPEKTTSCIPNSFFISHSNLQNNSLFLGQTYSHEINVAGAYRDCVKTQDNVTQVFQAWVNNTTIQLGFSP